MKNKIGNNPLEFFNLNNNEEQIVKIFLTKLIQYIYS